ncbi:hypothetical protein BS50DRAFT_571961 [Corynespora cassiicola Philippines]|uniref:Chitin-binding type-1 domain-containing protein n=1 Tax=Corynespora cassiicola Philippines TaxID=1448308 RepID=A0A2T2NTR9_CORCC|nr:hypothetical protein BS50DRAFT_571961 [Corynespora cassiicola Philippines]
MPSFATTIFLSIAASSLSLAAPAPVRQADCPSGFLWYTCASTGYAGCCSVNACWNDGVCPAGKSPSAPAPAPTTSKPTPDATPTRCAMRRNFNATLHTLWRDEPNRAGELADKVFLSQEDNRVNKINQIVSFELPEDARECSLNWFQETGPDFKVVNTGFVQAFNLDLGNLGPDSAWSVIGPMVPNKRFASPDFSNWDITPPGSDHGAGALPCKPYLNILTDLDGIEPKAGAEGSVTMLQNEKAGWFIEYCIPEEE